MKKIIPLLVAFFTTISFARQQNDEEFKKRHEAFGKEYAFAMQGPGAALAAQTILDQGGNLFDAAVAASFSQSVERPQSTGIGGGGFMLIHVASENKTYAIDFREVAPLAATEKMFLDEKGEVIKNKSFVGIHAVAVPGMVAGLYEIHQKFGKLPFANVVQPSIELAEKGAVVSKHMYDKLVSEKETLIKDAAIKKTFYHKDGTPYQIGETFVQKDLATTLRKIQKEGKKGFYEGSVRDGWLATSKKYGGNLTKEDFEKYQVKFRTAVEGTYKGIKIVSMPSPSSGGIHTVQIMGILSPFNLKKDGVLAPRTVHRVASAMQQAFMDRYFYLGDSDFVNVPVDMLLSKKHIDEMRKRIPKNKAVASKSMLPEMKQESIETAHFSMMDDEGNAVSATESVNAYFGAGLIAEGTGVVMNDTMDDFAPKPGVTNTFGATGGVRNAVGPQKRPVSSMSPTIIFNKEGKAIMSLGTPDGQRIIPCLALTLLNYFEFNMSLVDSISAVRYFNQWEPDEIRVDSPGFSPELTKSLEKMGHKVTPKDFFCKIQAVAVEKDQLHAFSDYRGLESQALAK